MHTDRNLEMYKCLVNLKPKWVMTKGLKKYKKKHIIFTQCFCTWFDWIFFICLKDAQVK